MEMSRTGTIAGEGVQILTYKYIRILWTLSSERCMSGHLYWDMGHPFFKVMVEAAEHLAVELSLHVPVLTIYCGLLWPIGLNSIQSPACKVNYSTTRDKNSAKRVHYITRL